MKNLITINARKFDWKIHRSWQAQLIEQKENLLVFVGEFEKEISHPQLGVIRRSTISYEYYWSNRWYNVFRFHNPDGTLRNYYCNINMPPIFENGVLNYIDLDIDILVWQDFSYEILDVDEFEENSRLYSYSPDIIKKCQNTLNHLINLIETRRFPFDFIEEKL